MLFQALAWIESEHEGLDERLPLLAKALGGPVLDRATIRSTLLWLSNEFASHAEREQRELFPWVERQLPSAEPTLARFRREHARVAKLASTLLYCVDDPSQERNLRELGLHLVQLLRDHGARERALVGRAVEVARSRGGSETSGAG